MQTLKLAYGSDRTLEIRLDSLDFFVDGRKGHFSGTRVRDFVVQVARYWPNVASYGQFDATPSLGTSNLPRLAHTAKKDLRTVGLDLELLRSRRNEGYQLAEGWLVVNESINSRQIADSLLGQIRSALEAAKQHVAQAHLESNAAGLMYVVRTQRARNLASCNYMLIEDAGWQLLYLLSEDSTDLQRKQRLIALKLKIEALASYALMWRVGDGDLLTPKGWRSEFATESDALFADLSRLVDTMLESGTPCRRTA